MPYKSKNKQRAYQRRKKKEYRRKRNQDIVDLEVRLRQINQDTAKELRRIFPGLFEKEGKRRKK